MYFDETIDTSLAGAEDEYANVSINTVGLHSVTQITFKIPPSFNGSGSWFAYQGERLGQGRDNAKRLLRESPEIALSIEQAVLEHAGLKRSEMSSVTAPAANA